MGAAFKCHTRRSLLAGAAALGLVAGLPAAASGAADYPSKNITFVVAAGVGGGTYILARTLAKVLKDKT